MVNSWLSSKVMLDLVIYLFLLEKLCELFISGTATLVSLLSAI